MGDRPGAAAIADVAVDAVIGAVAADAPAVAAVDLGADRPHVVWLNPAARELLDRGGPRRPREAALLAPPAARPWLDVVATVAANEPSEQWHTAHVDGPTPMGTIVRLRVRTLPGGTTVLVWFRPVDETALAAEEKAADAEQRFRALSASTTDGVLVSAQGARLAYVNDAFAELCGRAATDLRGTAWLGAVLPDDLPVLLEGIDSVLSGTAAEVTVRMAATAERPVRLRLAPLTTRERAAGFVGTAQQLTVARPASVDGAAPAGGPPVDALTGLAGRGRLVAALADAGEDDAVVLANLDGFRAINTEFGHDAGDRVLIEVAQRLTAAARPRDLVARLAGDEFVLLLPGIGDAVEVEGVRLLTSLTRPFVLGKATLRVGVSLGVVLAGERDDVTALLSLADQRVRRAKQRGSGMDTGPRQRWAAS
jgi:diguanylate cyclase (GGDEF)-like protein/PAS domain S-box-containing protein